MKYLALLALFCATTAQATLHSYDFEIGSGETGSFSYDDGNQTGQVLGLGFNTFDFNFMGQTYDATDMLFGSVWLLGDGTLDSAMAGFWGSNCSPGTCTVLSQTAQPGSTDIQFQFFGISLPTFGTQNFSHGFGPQTEASSLTLTYNGAVKQVVSEPGTLALLGVLAVLGLRRKKVTTA